MEVPRTYSCSMCSEVFATKSDRDNHLRQICQSVVTLIELNGTITTIERIDGKFKCFKCSSQFNRGNHLQSHWKKCELKEKTQSNNQTLSKFNLTFIVHLDYNNVLVEHLHYDGIYQVAVCDKCKYALPKEWIKGHFKDVHQILV